MKKKLTVGVFLILAVVLVASIVGVGGADAAKPHFVTATVTYMPTGGDNGNVTIRAAWEKYGPSEVFWWLGEAPKGMTGPHTRVDSGYTDLGGRTASYNDVVTVKPNLPCDKNYKAYIWLIAKNGRTIKGTYAADLLDVACP